MLLINSLKKKSLSKSIINNNQIKIIQFFIFICFLFPQNLLHAQEKPGLYLSNGAGMILEPVSSINEHEWTALVSFEDNTETIVLYKNGIESEQRVRQFNAKKQLIREAVEKDGNICEERLFTNQQMVLERTFLNQGSVREISYLYYGDKLSKCVSSLNGKEEYTTQYFYAIDGRLITIKKSDGLIYGSNSSSTTDTCYWQIKNGNTELNYYKNGRLVSVYLYNGNTLLSKETKTWDNLTLVSSEIEDNLGAKTIIKYIVDGKAKGSVKEKTIISPNNKIIEEYTYNEAGNITKFSTDTNGATASVEYDYGIDNSIICESYYSGAILERKVLYKQSERIEEFYDNGKCFARTYYKDNKKVKEEILNNGKILRTKEL